MQIPEKYKENFDVWSEGLPAKRQNSPLIYFSGSCIPTNESLHVIIGTAYTGKNSSRLYCGKTACS
jgi:hypothetical protein